MATLGVTTMSAGSHTEPGGYATHVNSLEQFAISDSTSPERVAADLRALGREPVWKDWDRIFDVASERQSSTIWTQTDMPGK